MWVCPEGESESQANALHDSIMPGSSGDYPPRAKRVTVHHNAEPGRAWITARYKSSRQPGEAQLIGRMRRRAKKLKKDLDGNVIEGPVGDGIHYYRITSGTNIVAEGVEAMILRTAVEELDLPGIRKNHNHVNADTLPNFGNAPPGSLLLSDVAYNRQFGEHLWHVDYYFDVCPHHDEAGTVLSWNETLYSQKGTWVVTEVPVYVVDANLPVDQWATTGELVRVKHPLPGYEYTTIGDEQTLQAIEPEARRPFPEADFSNMDAMLSW